MKCSTQIKVGLLLGISLPGLLFLTSCRIGNSVEKAPALSDLDGYYRTAPKRLMYCAKLNGAAENCAEGDSNEIIFYRAILSDPVRVVVGSLITGETYIANAIDQSKNFIANLSPNGGLNWDFQFKGGNENPIPDFTDCNEKIFNRGTGGLAQTAASAFSGFTTRGRLAVTGEAGYSYRGSCAQYFDYVRACMLDQNTDNPTQCGYATPANNQTQQEIYFSTYASFIESGVLPLAEFEKLESITHRLRYE